MNLDPTYISPFTAKYASKELSYLFSSKAKAITFRKLWLNLAKAQKEAGLPIETSQIEEMEGQLENIDETAIEEYEKTFRHDVMAHIHAFGDLCPKAKPILHLGATSCFVTDNADLILMKEALERLFQKLCHLLKSLSTFAQKEAKTPCIGSTHYQTAQPTTVGKRVTCWIQDFLWDAQRLQREIETLPFFGMKGATGTQSSLFFLLDQDQSKIKRLETYLATTFGFSQVLPISGQTYPRKLDILLTQHLASFAASAHKMGTDLRLLSHDKELFEGFGKTQIGSSAMPYKKNPIYAERACGIARFILSLAEAPYYTAATQWLERSLDDSSNRRLVLPDLFLGTDSLLNTLIHLTSRLEVDNEQTEKHLQEALPHLITENLLMAAVKKGKDRQDLHEKIRQVTTQGSIKTLLETDPDFALSPEEVEKITSIETLIGCAPTQVTSFLEKEVTPFLKKHAKDVSLTTVDR